MKRARWFALALYSLSVGTSNAGPTEEFRLWRSTAGSEIEARLVRTGSAKATVELETKAGRVIEVPLDQLTSECIGWLVETPGDTPTGGKMVEVGENEGGEEVSPQITQAAIDLGAKFVSFKSTRALPLSVQGFPDLDRANLRRAVELRQATALVPSTQFSRGSIPIFEIGRDGKDELGSSITSYLAWWSEYGLYDLDLPEGLEAKREAIERKLKLRKDNDWNDAVKETYEFVADHGEGLKGLNVTFVEKTTAENLNFLTRGADMVFASVSARSGDQREWVNRVSIHGVDGNVVSFQMWSKLFKATMTAHPSFWGAGEPDIVRLQIVPDANNREIDYLNQEGWTLYFESETVLISPLLK